MFEYNTGSNLLEIRKIPYQKNSPVYEEDDMYTSFKKYVSVTVKEDIKQTLIPAVNRMLNPKLGTDNYPFSVKEVKVVEESNTWRSTRYYSVFVTLHLELMNEDQEPFCIMTLPYMNPYGVIEREGKEYAMYRELVQDDDITYTANKLKIITKQGCFIELAHAASGPTMKFRKEKLKAFDVLFALAQREGLDCNEVYNSLVSMGLMNVFKTYDKLADSIEWGGAKAESSGFIDCLKSPAYSLEVARDKMNEVLSIDRALDYKLAESIELKDGTRYPIDTIITESIIKNLKRNHVDRVVVFDIPTVIGSYLAEPVYLPIIRKGTRMLPIFKEFFKDYTGAYMDHDVVIPIGEKPYCIEAGTQITEGMLEAIAYNNSTRSIILKENETSTTTVTVPLKRSINGNRHFKAADLGIESDTKWVYIDEDDNICPPQEFLCAHDLVAMLSLFDRLTQGQDYSAIANGDLGLRKKVNLTNETFHKAFVVAVGKFLPTIRTRITNYYGQSMSSFKEPSIMEPLFSKFTNDWWRQMYSDMKIIHLPERSNPTSYYSSFGKVCMIPTDKHAVPADQHMMTMSHYGRMCPYETPSGSNLGLTNNKALGCKIVDGVMRTCYHPVKHNADGDFVDLETVMWLSPREEESLRIADITALDIDFETGRIRKTGRVLARVPNKDDLEKIVISYVDVKYINAVNVNPNQHDSIVATTIPFQGSDDAARVTFGLSMCKQAKGLVHPEVPIVLTSAFIDIPRLSPYYEIHAEYDGEVIDVRAGEVIVFYPELDKERVYTYKPEEFSPDALVTRTLCVKEGDQVKAGQTLVTSNYMVGDYMATGINGLVAYVPKGSNYEDGIFGSDRLSQRLTSNGCKSEVENVSHQAKEYRINMVNKLRYVSPKTNIVKYDYLLSGKKMSKFVKSKKLKGFIVSVGVDYVKGTQKEDGIVVKTLSLDPLHQGDKLANRHGNKGVTPKIESNDQMLQFMNGEFVDLCYNPAGVSSRMNIGQILECNIGLAAYILRIRVRTDSFNGATTDEVKLLLSYAWHLANDDNWEAVFTMPEFSVLPKSLHEHSRSEIGFIRAWKDSFNEDGTARLFNPKTGKYLETDALVGINYIYKLIHEVQKKEQARGGYCQEQYIEKLASPTQGQKQEGGQREGYMELDALCAYGASKLIHEMQNERGDNPIARNNFTVKALHNMDSYLLDEQYAIRRSTEQFVADMEALGVGIDFEGELPNDTIDNCTERKFYKRNALIKASE